MSGTISIKSFISFDIDRIHKSVFKAVTEVTFRNRIHGGMHSGPNNLFSEVDIRVCLKLVGSKRRKAKIVKKYNVTLG